MFRSVQDSDLNPPCTLDLLVYSLFMHFLVSLFQVDLRGRLLKAPYLIAPSTQLGNVLPLMEAAAYTIKEIRWGIPDLIR